MLKNAVPETPGVDVIRGMDTSVLGHSELESSVPGPSELDPSVPGPRELDTSVPSPSELDNSVLNNSVLGRAGGSAKVAKVLAFASFGLQILESVNYVDMSCNVFTS